MVQVINNGAAMDELSRPAQVVQPCSHIGILANSPAGVLFVKPIDRQQIVAPESHVASDNPALAGIAPDRNPGPPDGFWPAGDLPRQYRPPDGSCVHIELRNKPVPNKTPPALDPEISLRQPRMIRDEPAVRHTIAVQENHILPAGLSQRFVEDDRLAKTDVLVPEMAQGNLGFPALRDSARFPVLIRRRQAGLRRAFPSGRQRREAPFPGRRASGMWR